MTLHEVSFRGYLCNAILFAAGAVITFGLSVKFGELYGTSLFHGFMLAIFLSIINFFSLHIIKRLPWYLLSLPAMGGFFLRICIMLTVFAVVKMLAVFDINLYACGFLTGLFITKALEIILLMKAES